MRPPKKSLPRPLSVLPALILAGPLLWIVSGSGFSQSWPMEDSLQIVDNADSDVSADASDAPCSSTAAKVTGSSLLSYVLPLLLFLSVPFVLTGAVFRLKLVLLSPSTGPPEALFA